MAAILEGLPAIIFGVVILFLTDWPKDAKWPEDERDWITSELEHEKQAKKSVKSSGGRLCGT